MTCEGATPGSASIGAELRCTLGSFSLDAAFTVPLIGSTVLFGPSGSGKTTLLRCVAGLQRSRGRLLVGGEVWQDDGVALFRAPHERPVGYVFQEASLFPHLSVRENLLFGARRAAKRGTPEALRFEEVVDLIGLGTLLARAPASLSGGERQRVAVGRALLSQPRLLLLDEPLSGLDAAAKEEILPYLEALHERLAIPMLYVTHDTAEADRLADTLVLLERGQVLAAGPLGELEARPDLPLLQAPQATVTLQGRVTSIDSEYSLTRLAVDGGALIVPGRHGPLGSRRRLRIGAADVSFTRVRPVETTVLNCLPARIVAVEPRIGDDARVHVVAALGEDGNGARIVGRVTRKSREALALAPGLPVFAQIKSVALAASGSGQRPLGSDIASPTSLT
ncbi:MAG TPA: molybdenum ABC transporter ATP-binding protein [Gammaproteobacteria bacterium]|nr:molybdenum ABC transporter ATP-binding protein [Gammaproteobacteria bacterium]